MKKILLILVTFFTIQAFSQEDGHKNIYLIFNSTDSINQRVKETKSNKGAFKIYSFFKEDSENYRSPNGYFFYHKKTKNSVFKDVEEKFWRAKSDTIDTFEQADKVVLDSNWFNKNDEDLIFLFFHSNEDYNYNIVYYDDKSKKYIIEEVVFGNTSSNMDYFDNNHLTNNTLKYELVVCGNKILKVVKDE